MAGVQAHRASRQLRDRLIFMFMPMVRYIVYRKVREVPAQCDVEDFLSCGLEALIRSIERYDPEKGATLEQYAWTRVHGAVLDELRRHDWAPRSLRRDERTINEARERFLAARTRTEPRGARGAGRDDPARADAPPRPGGARGGRLAEPHRALGRERHDRAHRHARERGRATATRSLSAERQRSQGALPRGVRAAEPRRSAKWRCCCTSRTGRCATIGERLGVSESRVSQIHTQLRRRLYEQLAGELPLFTRSAPPALHASRIAARRPNTRREMDLGLYIAASGMVAEQVRQDQLANDLSNASTPGFKPDYSPQHSFGACCSPTPRAAARSGRSTRACHSAKTVTDMTPGTMQETGEPLDFAIEGSGFFAVKTAQGVRYTRDGQFTRSAQGVLTDASGDPVLEPDGAQIKVGAGGTVPASAVGVFEVPGAVKQGENLYTGAAAGKASGTVRQGSLEGSGVDAAKVMVEMITSLRSFQSGQQAIQSIGQTLQEAASQVGSLNPDA